MSLINDALNRAQAEAAEREAAARGQHPPEPIPAPRGRSLRPGRLALVVALLLVVVFLAVRWRRALAPAAANTIAAAEATEIEAPAVEPRGASTPSGVAPPSAQSADSAAAAPAGRSPAPPPAEATPTPETQPASRPPAPSTPERADAPPEPSRVALPPAPRAQRSTSPSTADTTEPATSTRSVEPTDPLPDALAPIDGVPSAAPPAPVVQPDASAPPTTRWPAPAGGLSQGQEETWYYVGQVALPGGGEITLEGIAWSETAPSAMLNGSLLRVGSEILGLRIVSIAPRTVTLAGQGQRIALQLASRAD